MQSSWGGDPDDDGQAALPPWVTALPKSFLSPMVMTTAAAAAAATVTATKLGPGPSLATLGPVAPWIAQTCACVPDHQASYSLSGLHALGFEPTTHSAVWYLYCSHTCSIVPSVFTYRFSNKIIKNPGQQPQNIKPNLMSF